MDDIIKKNCDKCGEYLRHNERFDGYYCEKCNEWKEKKCDDPKCFFCSKRPDKPNKIKR